MTVVSPDAEPATRGDLDRLRLELRGDLATLRGDVERLRLELRGDIATTARATSCSAIHAQTRWIIGAAAAIAAITVAILRLT